MNTTNFYFEYPQYFFLIALIPLLLGGMFVIRLLFKKSTKIPFSSLVLLEKYKRGNNYLGMLVKYFLISLAFLFFIVSLATPKVDTEITRSRGSVVIVADTSISMLAEDISPNRLAVQREAALSFVEGLPDDTAIGLIFFNGRVSTQNSLINDKEQVIDNLNNLTEDVIDFSTAWGDALDESLSMLESNIEEGQPLQGSVLLLTDGESNTGVDPVELASEKFVNTEVKIYTIGIGSQNATTIQYEDPITGELIEAPIPPLVEDDLIEVAQLTGGEYFRATDSDGFDKILQSITDNSLTFTEDFTRNLWYYFAVIGLIILIILFLLFAH